MANYIGGIAILICAIGYTIRSVSKDLYLKGNVEYDEYSTDSFVGVCVMLLGCFFLFIAIISKIYAFFF